VGAAGGRTRRSPPAPGRRFQLAESLLAMRKGDPLLALASSQRGLGRREAFDLAVVAGEVLRT
jgi:hypothetical protein